MSEELTPYDPGQLPWLEAVEDEDEPSGLSARRMLIGLLAVATVIALVIAAFFWLGRVGQPASGAPELIRAPDTPYKVTPSDPGGLDVGSEGRTAFETSAGEDPDAELDLSRLPEAPMQKPAEARPSEPAATPAAPTAPAPKPATTSAPSGGSGSVIQLGAFQNQAQAERAWTALSARFPAVAAMTKRIVPFSGGIRLRAAGASAEEARRTCQLLKAAGENCFVAE